MSRVSVPTLLSRKRDGIPITMVTAYDATFARMLDEAGVDVLLVGDSLGMVVQGQSTTLPVTMDEMVYHTKAVARGTRTALVVGDMPFLSHQISPAEALRNAGRFLSEAGAHAVKLEGGVAAQTTIRALVEAGIPVMGHVGLMPQSVHAMGGFKVQGKDSADAERILADARAVAEAGAFSIVLEGIPADLAAEITTSLSIPTIGIGAGPDCDGQVLVCYDLLGLTPDLKPKFVKRYAELFEAGKEATRQFIEEVKLRRFPTTAHSFGRKPTVAASITEGIVSLATDHAPSYGPEET